MREDKMAMKDVSEIGRRDGESTVVGLEWATDTIIQSRKRPDILERNLCKCLNSLKVLSAELSRDVFKNAAVYFIPLEDAQIIRIAQFFYVVRIGIVHSL